MKNFKSILSLLVVATLFFTSCQKEQADQAFEQTIIEQSEEITYTEENLLKEKIAPEVAGKQLETMGMKSYLEIPQITTVEESTTTATARNASWIRCGETINSSTSGAGNNYNGGIYTEGCLTEVYDFDAPDKQYLLRISQTTDVTLTLTNLRRDLDIFIFSATSNYYPNYCIGKSINSNSQPERIDVRLMPGLYMIMIDGYVRSEYGSFRLTVDCGGNGNGNEGEGSTGARCEDFDNLYTGDIAAQSNLWKNWSNYAEFKAQVSGSRYASASKSVYVDHKSGYSAGNQPDVIRKVGDYSSGKYLMKWKMYVPSNRNAAFNIQKYDAQGRETGVAVYLRQGRGIAFAANNKVYQSAIRYNQNRWIDITLDYDLSNESAHLLIDNQVVAIWNTRIQHGTRSRGANRISGINFWAYHDATTFYIDDVCTEDISGMIIDYFPTNGAIYLD